MKTNEITPEHKAFFESLEINVLKKFEDPAEDIYDTYLKVYSDAVEFDDCDCNCMFPFKIDNGSFLTDDDKEKFLEENKNNIKNLQKFIKRIYPKNITIYTLMDLAEVFGGDLAEEKSLLCEILQDEIEILKRDIQDKINENYEKYLYKVKISYICPYAVKMGKDALLEMVESIQSDVPWMNINDMTHYIVQKCLEKEKL